MGKLIAEKRALDRRIGGLGKDKLKNALVVYDELAEALDLGTELAGKREEVEKGAMGRKVKFAGQLKRCMKSLAKVDRELATLFSGKAVREEDARQFAKAIVLGQKGEFDAAKNEMEHFKPMLELRAKGEAVNGQLDAIGAALEKEARRAEEYLAGINDLQRAVIDGDAIERYSRLLEGLHAYEEWRLQAIGRMKKAPLTTLISSSLKGEMAELGFPPAQEDALGELSGFLSKEKSLASCPVSELVEMAGLSEARLSHMMSGAARFLYVMDANREWLSELMNLESTGFLRVDLAKPESAGVLVRFLTGKPVPPQVTSFIQTISSMDAGELRRIRGESEKSERLEGMRKRFDVGRKGELEETLAHTRKLLGMLEAGKV